MSSLQAFYSNFITPWSEKTNKKYILLIILLLGLSLRIIFFTGTATSDELTYYEYAHKVTQGTFSIELSHFSFRLGVIYPPALFFFIFGINELSANGFVLILSLLGILLIYFLGKEMFTERAGLIAAFLLSIFPLDIFYATRLLPDLPSAFFMALTVLFFFYAERGFKPALFFTLSGISFGIAYLMKEVSLLLGLFFFGHILYNKRFKFAYSLIGIGPALSILLVFLVSYHYTGDPFFQKHSNQNEEIAFLKEYYPNYFTLEGILKRTLLYLPYQFLTNVYYGSFFIVVLISLLYIFINKKKEPIQALLWMLPLLLYINFGTISFKEYVLFPLEFRHVFIIVYPSILIMAYFIENLSKRRKIILLSLLLIVSLGCNVYLQDKNQATAIKQAKQYLSDLPDHPIYADDRTARVLEYLYGFSTTQQIIPYNTYDYSDYTSSDKNREILNLSNLSNSYVIVNNAGILGSRTMHPSMQFPPELFSPPASWSLLTEIRSQEGSLIIYNVD